jgi:hypothetical protein
MPRTELVSKQADGTPNWVEWRDSVMSAVRFDVKDAVKSTIRAADDGTGAVQDIPGANDDRQRAALWWHIVTDWSFAASGIPIPSQNAAGKDGVLDLIGATLTDEDYDKLADATQEILTRMTRNPKRGKPSTS